MNIHQTIIAIMGDLEAIKKLKRNNDQNFMFRGIDDVYNALHPLCAKHGLYSVPTNIFDDITEERKTRNGGALICRMFKVEYTFFASDGSSVKAITKGEGMDTGDKATNKAMSAAHKYVLLQVMSIPTEDIQDPDADGEHSYSHDNSNRVSQQPSGMVNPPGSVDIQELRNRTSTMLESCSWGETKKVYFRRSIQKMDDWDLLSLMKAMQKDGGSLCV